MIKNCEMSFHVSLTFKYHFDLQGDQVTCNMASKAESVHLSIVKEQPKAASDTDIMSRSVVTAQPKQRSDIPLTYSTKRVFADTNICEDCWECCLGCCVGLGECISECNCEDCDNCECDCECDCDGD